ncbi:9613_t:CDS:2 [Racocetra fulgida]|uniref:9613_t:CDS:1 n=1 Tax=Racocetra fulgida TaxID=60492 RepID=A0A9N8ZH37_9GLOM|nr:9613_t:CDS:2 [Racocetra fulgida]
MNDENHTPLSRLLYSEDSVLSKLFDMLQLDSSNNNLSKL